MKGIVKIESLDLTQYLYDFRNVRGEALKVSFFTKD
jgi:hypothetical protein